MTINELREKRNTAWENAKNFLETHRMENGLISAADARTYDKMVQDISRAMARKSLGWNSCKAWKIPCADRLRHR